MEAIKFILNLIFVPIKLVLLLPITIVCVVMALAGYFDESADLYSDFVLEKWVK
jgi:hypothetical protein